MRVIEWGWLELVRLQTRGERWARILDARCSGQSTVEYALVGAVIVIAAAAALSALGGEITNVFGRITSTLAGAASSGH
jgi:Flp pilus assembly pilin Flp